MNQLSPSPLYPTRLQGAVQRDFGSVSDFRRTFFHTVHQSDQSENIWLMVSPRGKLQLICAPKEHTPFGCMLFRVSSGKRNGSFDKKGDEAPEMRCWQSICWVDAEQRYRTYLERTPNYPIP